MAPIHFSSETMEQYDASVLSGISRQAFRDSALKAMVEAVENQGSGLFFINGDHDGNDPEAESVLATYKGSPLSDLVPVSSDPRPHTFRPPGRQVVIVMDQPGSMDGWKSKKAKQIAVFIIDNLLTSEDELHLFSFSSEARYLYSGKMTLSAKMDATHAIKSMRAGGGTRPESVFKQVAGLSLDDCGLVFISDGKFNPVPYRPDCRTAVFAMGYDFVPPHSPLWKLAAPFPVNRHFDPVRIAIPYFEPEKRKRFFEPETFAPASMTMQLSPKLRSSVPELPLPGSAVSYVFPESVVPAIRPKCMDPILAFEENQAGYAGAFQFG